MADSAAAANGGSRVGSERCLATDHRGYSHERAAPLPHGLGATIYDTLNLLVRMGIRTTQLLREWTVVFDPNVARHLVSIDVNAMRSVPKELVERQVGCFGEAGSSYAAGMKEAFGW